MVNPWVILHTQFPASHKLVAYMLQRFPPGRLAILVLLMLTRFGVKEAADL